jgi:hypothetical protein
MRYHIYASALAAALLIGSIGAGFAQDTGPDTSSGVLTPGAGPVGTGGVASTGRTRSRGILGRRATRSRITRPTAIH